LQSFSSVVVYTSHIDIFLVTKTDVVDSSHSLYFQSNSFHHDPYLPHVEVNKFDGFDHIGWVTQMEHYFSLHGIIDKLAKIHYVFFYLDTK
jgi:hypothetical protein